ncbi:MAG: T9SS type A sorting domain-containing protein [Saprospiraceae bacterium]|nr:T9SS type A sorting domain-containing protein [Saprospiraceae bacterium]
MVSKITKSDVKCYSCKCGSATADASGGTAPYVYTWSNGVNTALNDKIKAGVYYLTITDNNGCKVIDSITINQPTPLELEISKTNIKCNGANDGTASIVAKGGTPPYTFNWTNGQTTTTINNLAPGFYEVTVIDANKCVNYETVEIEEPTILEGNISKTEPKCFGDNSASLTINAVGGTSPYSFNWSTGAISSTISNLVAGTYTVTITDNNGCKKVMSETINDASLLIVKLNKSDVKCHSGNDATITSEVTGGKQSYSYLWNTGATTASLSNLTAGNYSITVTDANGCTKSSSIEINQPTEILIDLTSVSIKCNGQNTGSIAANVSGGTTGYSYLWSNGATTSSINNLVAGTYSVTITDANGCKKTKSLTLQEPSILDGTITKIDVKCFGGNDGSATATAIGGTAPYSYSWNNGAQTQTINNLKAGKYSVIITDANGCLVKKEIEILEQSQILVSISKTQLKCANSTDGSATAFATGGKAPYSYKWSNGGNTETITNLGAGVYTVTATDSNGCTATSFITIGAPNPIVISLDKVNISCYGAKDGIITANVSGGTLPIDLLWNTGAITNKISNLSQGIYTITATDANKCIATTSTSILEPTELNVSIYKKDPLCNNGTDGELKATVSGGTSPYVYKWNNGATEQVLKNLPSGTYVLTVCDANKCTKVISITLNNPTPIEASLTITNPKCNGDKGTASVNANGGSPNYTYLWSNGETASVNNKLTNGSFSVTITDSKGCTLVKTGEIISPSALVCNATVILKANCTDISTYGGNDGSAKVTTTGGTGNYSYIWSNGTTTSTVNNLSAGSYQVTVTDANGCSCVSSVTLKNPARLGDYVWVDSNRNGIQDNGEAGKQGILATLTGTDIKGNKITKTVYTDINGKYIFDGLYDGDYKVTFELPVGYKFTKSNAVTNDDIDSDVDATNGMTQIVTLKQGDDVKNLDGGVYKTVNIGNYVWIDSDLNGLQDSSESGINNIKVKLIAPGNDGVFNTSDDIMIAMQNTTNNNGKPGYYLFTDVALGNYCIAFSNLPADYIFTSKDQGTNNAIDSDVDTAGTVKISVIAGQNDDLTIDAGIHLKCNNTIFGGTVGVDQVLCGAGQTAATITNLQLPTGGSGTLEYLWLKSTVGPNYVPGDPNWIPISNSNSPDYAPGVLNQTTYFVRCSRRVPCIDYPSESNIITIKVEAIPVADFENFPTGDICVGKKYSISAVDGGVGTSYDWTLNGANPSIANTRVVNDVQWNTIGTYNVKLKVTKNSCVNEKSVNVNVASCINGNIIFGKLNIKLNNSVADLDWTTITPNAENFMFEIEHSDDGRSYRSVGFLNPNNTEIYKFTHTNPTVGTNYYRIKHIAINNRLVYSNTVNTLLKFDQFENFVTYPNPTNNIVVVKPLFDVKQKFTVQVVNTIGQVLQTIEKDPGTTYFEVDLTNYTQGMYLLYFSFDKFKHHTQWILKNDE